MFIGVAPSSDFAELYVRPTPQKRPRPSQLLNRIDFWAFLSIEIVLLIIFMVHVPSNPYHRAPIDLAAVDHARPMPGAIREDALLITVTRDGRVFYGTYQMQSGDLPPAIQEAVRRGSERKVYLKVDARAKYGDAVVVMDQIQHAGIQNVGIITEQRQPIPQ
jgi:biopolymer transport protein ExbD